MTKKDGTYTNLIRIIERKSKEEARDHVKTLIEGVVQESVKLIENNKKISMAKKAKEIDYITNSFEITHISKTTERKARMYFE